MGGGRWMVLGLLAIALALRLAAVEGMLRVVHEQLPDSQLYEAYAQTIYHGQPYRVGDDGARRPPGYPLFLAVFWWLGGGEGAQRAVLWAQAVLSTMSCGLIWWVAKRWQDCGLPVGTALGALLLTALDPYAIVLAALELSETLFTALLIAAVAIGSVLCRRVCGLPAVLLGVVVGAAVLVRPSCLLLVPIGGILWWRFADDRRTVGRVLGIAALGMLLVLMPWWYRNYRVYRTFVPTTLNVGESLYDGLNPHATGASDMGFLDDARRRAEYLRMSEVDRNRLWWDRAVDFAVSNPGRVLELAAIKVGRFWSPWPNEQRFRSPMVVAATALATIPVWGLALLALCKLPRGFVVVGVVPALYFCAIHSVFVSSVRYRAPAMPLLAVLAGAGFALLAHRFADYRFRHSEG